MTDPLAPSPDASTVPPEAVRRVHLGENAAAPVVVEVTRGTMVESLHRVSIAVVDSDGKAVHALGAIDRPIYGRSAIKPLQALQVIETGAADAFELGADEITLCCASHKGEAMHTDRVAAWLGRLGLSVDDLECGPQIPYHDGSAHAMLARGETPGRAHNNCSGKHSGMLTSVMHMGETVKGYLSPDHPVQQRCVAIVEEMAGESFADTARGIDGCGIPVFGSSIRSLAYAMARLADPKGMSDTRKAACGRIIASCAEFPLLISGTGSFNSAVLAETGTRVLLKGGAEGVYTAAIPELGLGVCLKADDGAGRGAEAAMLWTLQQLGVVDEAMTARIEATASPVVRNWAGTFVGTIRPSADLAF